MDTASRMTVMPSAEEMARLRALVPMHTLPDEVLADLIKDAGFETVGKGALLFNEGDTDHENIYLIEGTVALLTGRKVVDTVKSDSDTARFPLAHQLPRMHSAKAKTKLRIARIDSRRLSEAVAKSRTVDYQVDDLSDATEDDWMSMLLQSRVLQQVPASNIQQVMMNVQQVEVDKGDDLIRQGDAGDFYYMLTRGRAVVRRDNNDGKGAIDLATLGPGDAFGEEALLSDNPRNSTVTMLNDGEVLRLGKENFLDLIHNPLLDRLDRVAAQAKVDGGALWLDLRSSEQYDSSHFPGAINFPFESLRYQASSLSPDRHYVLYSHTGGRAMAGAFLLTERGLDVSVLDESITAELIDSATPQPAGGAEAIEAPPAPAMPEATGVVGEVEQDRVRQAETRAMDLEAQLLEAQREHEGVVAEHGQRLMQVSHAVDQAKRKLLESEQQKRQALADRDQARTELERLAASLEAAEQERAALQGRQSELESDLQKRLAKAERELIGERERAESAASSLEELSEKVSDLRGQRDQEHERYARERGELKEEVTALQLELEQARADFEEIRSALASQADKSGADAEALAAFDQQLADSHGQTEGLQQQLAEMSGLLDTAHAERDALQQKWEEADSAKVSVQSQLETVLTDKEALDEQREGLAGQLEEALEQQSTLRAEMNGAAEEQRLALEQLRAEHEALRDSAEVQQRQAADTDTQRIERIEALEQQLEERERQQLSDTADYQVELKRLREEQQSLQAALTSGNEEAGATIERAEARSGELQQQLQQQRDESRAELESRQTELTALKSALSESRQSLEDESAARQAAEQSVEALQQAAEERQQTHESELAGLRAQTDELRIQRDDIEETLVQRQDELAELHEQFGKLREAEESETASRQLAEQQGSALQAALDEARAALAASSETAEAEIERLQGERDGVQQALTASTAEAEAGAAEKLKRISELEAALKDAEQRIGEQQAEHTSLNEEAALVGPLRKQLEQQQEKAATASAAAQESLDEAAETLRQEQARMGAEIERLNQELAAKNDSDEQAADDGSQQELRSERDALAHRLEERELALHAAREEQAELIEALNAAGAERENLQFEVNERDDEQARLVDLENRLTEAVRLQEGQLLKHEQEQHELNELLTLTQSEVERLQQQIDDGAAPSERALIDQRDSLIAELAVRDTEVEQLRGVIEEYVDQIRGAQNGGDAEEVAALRTELNMVREQAIQDVAQMRERLAAVETQKRRMQEADGREAISLESKRQRIEELESSLAERQRELADAEKSHQMLEDELEDGNRQLDEFRREVDKAADDAEQMASRLREAEKAREQLQEAIRELQEDSDQSGRNDLRDARLAGNSEPLSLQPRPAGGRMLAAVLGAGGTVGALEAFSLLSGRGEFFGLLLKLVGP